MANKIQFGLKNLHVATLTTESTGTYAAPVAIPGVVKLSLKPEGKSSEFYADNTKYFAADVNTGYSGDLEAALIPDDVLDDMLGWSTDTNGLLIELADAIQKPFAMLFEVDGDATGKRYVYYNCIAARPDAEHNTKGDSIAPDTAKLSLTIAPISLDSIVVVKGSIENSVANATIYNAWYTAVKKPHWPSA